MADSTMDKIIEDLVKGASRNTRDNGGPGVNIVVDRENRGHEEKLAFALPPAVMEALMHPGVAGALAGGAAGGLGSLISGDGHALRDIGVGAGVGGLGQLAGSHGMDMLARGDLGRKAAMFAMSDPKAVAQQLVHGSGPAIKKGPPPIPAAAMAKKGPPPTPRAAAKAASLEDNYVDGIKAAAAAFGVKEAFLPALLPLAGSLLGGTALRAGAGALARGAGGKMLGGLASKALPMMSKGLGAAATDMAGSMAGGAIGQRLAPQQQQQPQMMN